MILQLDCWRIEIKEDFSHVLCMNKKHYSILGVKRLIMKALAYNCKVELQNLAFNIFPFCDFLWMEFFIVYFQRWNLGKCGVECT